jgi:hypothetical protein
MLKILFPFIFGVVFLICCLFFFSEQYLYILSEPYFNLLHIKTFILTDLIDLMRGQIIFIISVLCFGFWFLCIVNSFIFSINFLFRIEIFFLYRLFFLHILIVIPLFFFFKKSLIIVLEYLLSLSYTNYPYLLQGIIDLHLVAYIEQLCLYCLIVYSFSFFLTCLFMLLVYYIHDRTIILRYRKIYYLLIFFLIIFFIPGEVLIHCIFLIGSISYFEIFILLFCFYNSYYERVA